MADETVATFHLTVSRPGFDWEDLDAEAFPLEVAEDVELGLNAVVASLTEKHRAEGFIFQWRDL